MFHERLILRSLSFLRSGPGSCKNVALRFRFFHGMVSADSRFIRFLPATLWSIRHFAQNSDLKVLTGERGYAKETILRGKAATAVQEALLTDFIKEFDEASCEQWKSLLDKLFELRHGMIHEMNVDGRILEKCYAAKKLPLARSYLNFVKSSGKKFNTASACGFIRICYENESLMTPEDKFRMQLFTKYLLTKHQILDPVTSDAVIKGLILSGMGEQSFQVLKNFGETTEFLATTYAALASYLIKNDQSARAIEYIRLMTDRSPVVHHDVFIEWIEHFKDNRQKLDDLLTLFRDIDLKPSKIICDHLVSVFQKLPHSSKLEGCYGHVKNSGVCSICNRPLKRLDLSEKEFEEMRASVLQSLVGEDIFQNSTPQELRHFLSFVQKNAPFNIILDGLNIAFMTGKCMSQEVFVGLTKGVIQHFYERDNKMLLIGRNHMKKWPNFLSTLNEFGVKYFFIDDLSEDDFYIIYSTLYSGMDAYFVTRDLFRSEKYGLLEEYRDLFKRWQQSHQIIVNYVAPSGKVYMKTPISFQMMVQKTSSGGWHIPYTALEGDASPLKDDYGIHRKWLCLDRYLM